MGKTSLKDLDALQGRGWKLPKEASQRIAQTKNDIAFRKALEAIGELVSGNTKVSKDVAQKLARNADLLTALAVRLKAGGEVKVEPKIEIINPPTENAKKQWRFAVKRNRDGLIEEVIATPGG